MLARLCEASSELHIAETWYRGTALEDLSALPAPLVNDDRLYRALLRAPDMRGLERQLGRLLERNQRAAGRYVIEFVPDATLRAGARLDWHAQPEWNDWARWSEGCYVLRTNVNDRSPDDLWRPDIQLTDAEAAFRIQKSELGIRPVWHQRADRVQAHILVCFLAYVLWKTLEQWQSTDVVLPTEDGRELRSRCVVRLGLDLTLRLRVLPPVVHIAEV